MNLLELVIYQSCNYKCPDCPMAKWLYEPDEKDDNGVFRNAINNEMLLKWLDKYLEPNEWFIEITGGEPGLYPKISQLLSSLSDRGYKGVIRTNGSKFIPGVRGFKRVAAWHKDKPFPENYDYILILENPNEDWKKKEQHCINNNIPHVVFPYKNFGSDYESSTTYPPKPNKYFNQMTTVFSSGAITGCFSGAADLVDGPSIQKMSEPVIADFCRTCGNIEAVEYFMDNIPNFLDQIKESFSLTERQDSVIYYPMLTADNNWVDETGFVWGVLGDNFSEIREKYNTLKNKRGFLLK